MHRSLLAGLACVCLVAACSKPAEPAPSAGPGLAEPAEAVVARQAAERAAAAAPAAASGLPADVAALNEKWETCLHFAGEEPYDDARRAEINAAVEENCRPVKNALPALKAKYASDATVMAKLAEWEELVGSMN